MKVYKITLIDVGPAKLHIVKAIKDNTPYGLHTSKMIVNRSMPSNVILTQNRTKARKLAKALREARATVKSTIQTY